INRYTLVCQGCTREQKSAGWSCNHFIKHTTADILFTGLRLQRKNLLLCRKKPNEKKRNHYVWPVLRSIGLLAVNNSQNQIISSKKKTRRQAVSRTSAGERQKVGLVIPLKLIQRKTYNYVSDI